MNEQQKLDLILARLDDFIYRMAQLERTANTSPIRRNPWDHDDDDDADTCFMCSG